ncbi:hypothetical protein [Methyloglobulus sp.]|uniref:hypothetical protein n=1 Tax=Methyloglobulus sp. TaxID=2518622 RepID=UPI003988BFC3
MNLIINAWDWLSKPENWELITFIGGGIVVLVAAVWKAYLHFSKKPTQTKPTITASGNGIASSGNITATASNGGNAVVATGDVTIGMTSASVENIVTKLINKHQLETKTKDELKALTEAVTALSKGQNTLGTEAQVKAALAALAQRRYHPGESPVCQRRA